MSSKTYWSTLKTFVNGQKIPIIPPLLVHDKFITNFFGEANLFNEFSSKQCRPLQNNSTLPKSNTYHSENRLNDITFDNQKLLKIIQSLDANKAHGYDGISIRMLKLSSPSKIKPLLYHISGLHEIEYFPRWLEKGKHWFIIKNNKQLVKNYRLVSLLRMCSKNFGRLTFDTIFNFMIQNNFLNNCQSGFRPNYFCVNQLISITHIYRAFDDNPSLEVRGVFLDLSKAFDQIWHGGLLYKLKNNGIDGNALQLIESFPQHTSNSRFEWPTLQLTINKSWRSARINVLIYINDLPQGLNSELKLLLLMILPYLAL